LVSSTDLRTFYGEYLPAAYGFFSISRNVRNSISFSRNTYAEIDGIVSVVYRKMTGLNYLFV